MNNDVIKFDVDKVRILCYVSLVNDKKKIFFNKKNFSIKKINKCFREMHNSTFKS